MTVTGLMPSFTSTLRALRALRAASSALAGPGPRGGAGAGPGLGVGGRAGGWGRGQALFGEGLAAGARWESLSWAPDSCRRWLSGSTEEAGAAAGGARGVGLSETAVRRLREVNAKRIEGDPEIFLRVTVDSGGCGGFQYAFSLDTVVAEGEICFEYDGAKVVVDQVTLEYMEGSVVDFEDTLMRAGFAVASNPKASSKCGCGTSFTPLDDFS